MKLGCRSNRIIQDTIPWTHARHQSSCCIELDKDAQAIKSIAVLWVLKRCSPKPIFLISLSFAPGAVTATSTHQMWWL